MAIFNNKKAAPELGFGNKNYNKTVRFISEGGRINVKRKGQGFLRNLDIYHWFITTSLTKLILVIIAGYTIANVLFASAYFAVGAENFGGLDTANDMTKFFSLFFFSAQTLTTVGYGHVYPLGITASTISAIESLTGLMGFALATGILYGRFSRPKADLIYSQKALIAPFQDITAFMFRITNKMQYELIECEASLTMSFKNLQTGKREFAQLKLEISKINFMTLS